MRRTFLLASACLLAATAAMAEPPPKASGNRPMPTIAPPEGDEGESTIQMTNGYLRYRTDEVDTAEGDAVDAEEQEGSFSVMPRDPASREVATPAPVAATETSAEPEPLGEPLRVSTPAQEPCMQERALLSQRLLQIRGIFVDPASALVTLPQLEVPFSPFLTRAMFGSMTPYIGGTILANAISWDAETQQLTQKLAQCLLE